MYNINFYEYAYNEFLVDAKTGEVYGLDAYSITDGERVDLLDWVLSDVQVEEPARVEIELCGKRSYLAWNCTHKYIEQLKFWLELDFADALDVEDEDERVAEAERRNYGFEVIPAEDVKILMEDD